MKSIIKLSAILIIIYFLINYNIININEIKKVFNNLYYVFLILFLMSLTLPIATYKWWTLLNSEKYNISYFNTYLLYSTGLFFNIFMPGNAGGDFAKGYYLFKHVERSQRTLAIFTILVDRAIGLHSLLFVISVAGFIIFEKIYYNYEIYKIFYITLFFMFLSIPVIFIIINYSNSLIYIISKFKDSKFKNILIKLLNSLQIYKDRKIVILKCWLISIVNHFLFLSCFYIVSIALNIVSLSYFEVIFSSGASMITSVIPITPGGIGIGEGSFNYFSNFFANNDEKIAYGSIFFITIRVLFNSVCLLGAISYMLIRKPGDVYRKEL